MKELQDKVNHITTLFGHFAEDAEKQADSGNKSAGQRARKLSLEIEKELKEFRRLSNSAANN